MSQRTLSRAFLLEEVFLTNHTELDQTMGGILVRCAVTDLGVQWFGWALAAAFRTEKFYDLAGNTNTLTLQLPVDAKIRSGDFWQENKFYLEGINLKTRLMHNNN